MADRAQARAKKRGRRVDPKGMASPDLLFEQAKEQGVCIFYQRDLSRRDNCPFKHEKLSVPANQAPPTTNQGNTGKAKAAAAPKATPKAAAVAMVVAATVASGATAT